MLICLISLDTCTQMHTRAHTFLELQGDTWHLVGIMQESMKSWPRILTYPERVSKEDSYLIYMANLIQGQILVPKSWKVSVLVPKSQSKFLYLSYLSTWSREGLESSVISLTESCEER